MYRRTSYFYGQGNRPDKPSSARLTHKARSERQGHRTVKRQTTRRGTRERGIANTTSLRDRALEIPLRSICRNRPSTAD